MKTISFVNMKGGVGKTTVALNVADCLARVHQKKVVVLDVDPQFNATQCLFTGEEYVRLLRSEAETILNVFESDSMPLASVVSGKNITPPKSLKDIKLQTKGNLWTLPGNINLYRLEMVAGEGREFSLKRYIEQAITPQGFDYVIIDTPPTPSIWMTSALIASDHYVIPVRPDPLSLIGIDLLKSIIERRSSTYNLKLSCLGVVLTMVERPDSQIYINARTNLSENPFWKGKLLNSYIPKRSELARQQLEQPFILQMDDYGLRRNLNSVVTEILKKSNEN